MCLLKRCGRLAAHRRSPANKRTNRIDPIPTDRVRRHDRIRAPLIPLKGHRIIRITHSMCTQAKLWWCNSRLSLWR